MPSHCLFPWLTTDVLYVHPVEGKCEISLSQASLLLVLARRFLRSKELKRRIRDAPVCSYMYGCVFTYLYERRSSSVAGSLSSRERELSVSRSSSTVPRAVHLFSFSSASFTPREKKGNKKVEQTDRPATVFFLQGQGGDSLVCSSSFPTK